MYFKSLVGEMERRKAEVERAERERARGREAGLRVVTGKGKEDLDDRDDEEEEVLVGPRFRGMGEGARATTPTEGRSHEWGGFGGLRARASSGD